MNIEELISREAPKADSDRHDAAYAEALRAAYEYHKTRSAEELEYSRDAYRSDGVGILRICTEHERIANLMVIQELLRERDKTERNFCRYDAQADMFYLMGHRFSGALIREFCENTVPTPWFRVIKREDGLITVERLPKDDPRG